jgi:D-xylose 1-dehydrogenase (NADP+, D-xylono-1,5-lactone-forming)
VKWGLLSTARINDRIIAAAVESDRAAVVAVASRDAVRAADYARAKGIARAHGSYEALLDDRHVDAVYIGLPNGLHHPWTMRALKAGKHVLCEKPYGRRAADVEEAYEEAARGGRVLMEAFMYRHHPQIRQIKAIVDGGAIGSLRTITSTFTFLLEDPRDVRLHPELEGGALMDVGCYCVHGIRFLGGEPVSVFGDQVLGDSGVDTGFYATMWHGGDVLSQFDASFMAPRTQRLEIVGEEGVLVAQAPFRWDWGGSLMLKRGGRSETIEVQSVNAYRLQLENMADAASGVAAPLLGRADATAQARTIEALYRSAEERRVVEVQS